MDSVKLAVLVVLERPVAAAAELAAAARLARRLGGAGLIALAVRLPAAAAIMVTEEVLTAERKSAWEAREDARLAALRAACVAMPLVELEVEEGDPAEIVAARGKRSDYLVIARPTEEADAASREIAHAALFDTGRPVLVVPAAFAGDFGRRIAIAFKDGPAEKAVLAAAPLLRQAERVLVFGKDPSPDALIRHGVAARPRVLPGHDFGQALLAAIAEDGDDMLVMGAYTHGAWREALLGGVTRHVLSAATVPVLMQH